MALFRHRHYSILLCFAALSVACQPSARQPEYELAGATMGTTYSVKIVAPPTELSLDALRIAVQQSLDAIEQLASTYNPQSELSQFNSSDSTDWIGVSGELCTAVAAALVVSAQTGGAFDITVGPLVNLWGFGPQSVSAEPPADADIDALLQLVGYQKLQTRCDKPAMRKRHAALYVDLSGWAKGFAADRLAALLAEQGLASFLVEVGGELRVQGLNAESKEWAIAIEKPLFDGRDVQSVMRMTDTGVATSGDYRNFFEHDGRHYSHLIDPRNGRPVTHNLASVTVLHPAAATADALATALLVLGPEAGPALARELGIRAYFLLRTADGFETIATPTD